MGSEGFSCAKQKFFKLVDTISTSDIPPFTIWLDAKLAEYKTVGQLRPDNEEEAQEQYPEWIARSLRQNLSSIFPSLSRGAVEGSFRSSVGGKPQKRRSSKSSDLQKKAKKGKMEPTVCADHEEESLVGSNDTRTVAVKIESASSSEDNQEALASDNCREEDNCDAPKDVSFTVIKEAAKNTTSTCQKAKSLFSRSAADNEPKSGAESSDQKCARDKAAASKLQAASCSPLFDPLPASTSASEHSGNVSKLRDSSYSPVFDPIRKSTSGSEHSGSLRVFRKNHLEYSADEVEEAVMKYHAGKQSTYAVTVEDIEGLRDDRGMLHCPLCGKESLNIHKYRRHFVTHTKERPFKCTYCPKTFCDSGNLYYHRKRDHKDLPHVKAEPVV